jgi:hypothetical protein
MEEQSLPESMWHLKPWWCQPWSIVATGLTVLIGLWVFTHRLWLVAPVGTLILLWWSVFLYLVPKQYQEYRNSLAKGSIKDTSNQ